MKKLVKKVLTTICTLVLCLVCLTGCSWLEINKGKYYDQIVVTIGDKMEFTKKDLVEAFSTYGYQYYQQYGYSMEESINQTISSMIDRELLMDYVVNEAKISITAEEKTRIKKESFDYMRDSIKTFEDKIRKEWEMEITTETPETVEPLRTAETEYSPKTEYVDGVVVRIEDDADESLIPDNLPENFNKEYYLTLITDRKIANEAWTRYVKSLQDLAKSEGRSTVESDVLKFEQERLIDLLSTNKYLEKFEKNFFDNTPVDVQSVLDYYKEQYKSQKETYSSNESLYHTAMTKASTEYVYYHVNSGNEYVNVKHILINFTQEQKDAITTLNKRYGITDDGSEADEEKKTNSEYKRQLNEIVNRTKTTFEMSEDMYNNYALGFGFRKVEGKESTYEAYASDIYSFVRSYSNGVSLREKSSKFDDLIYVFNDDPGIMNSEFDYVVNLDTSVKDQMVKPFADGVRALDTSNGGEGAGSMDMIVSTYGLHIIFHDGVAENLVNDANIDNISDEQLLAILCTTKTTPDSNKSIFNFIYDKLNLDDNLYNNMTQKIVSDARTQLKANNIVITYYENNYKDLFE